MHCSDKALDKNCQHSLEINNRYFPRVWPLIQKGICMKVVLFLCTGNSYRSRFAEEMFNFLAPVKCPGWTAVSRGNSLDLGINNVGPIATSTAQALQKQGIIFNLPLARKPLQLEITDLESADYIVALHGENPSRRRAQRDVLPALEMGQLWALPHPGALEWFTRLHAGADPPGGLCTKFGLSRGRLFDVG
jgi:protein-tyrosine-phosphatase